MINLTIEQIQDYQYCPRFYELKHVKQLELPYEFNIYKHFDNSMRETAFWFFRSISEGVIPSKKDFRNKFGKIYIGDRKIISAISLNSYRNDLFLAYEHNSIKMLNNFYDKFSEDYGITLFIDKEYTLKIGGVIISGTIPVVRDNEDDKLEILNFYTNPYNTNRGVKHMGHIIMNYDMGITATSVAFEKIYTKVKDNLCYNFSTNSTHNVNKDSDQIRIFYNTIKSIGIAIHNKLFYPVCNKTCINCAYNIKCMRD